MMKTTVVLCAFLLANVLSAEMTSNEVVEKAVAALGGKKAQSLQSYIASGKVEVAGLFGTYEVQAKVPDRYLLNMDLGVVKQVRGFDGNAAWIKQASISVPQGPDLQRIKRTALFMPLIQYAQAGTPSRFKGAETVGEKKAYVVEFTPQGGLPELFYFDANSFLLLRELRQVPNRQEKFDTVTIDYADYRDVNGIKFPFEVTQTQPGQVMTVHFDRYTANPPLNEAIFHNPSEQFADEPYEFTLRTIPHHIYKENDGIFESATTESFYFRLVAAEKHSRPADPLKATLRFYSGQDLIETAEFSEMALNAIRGTSLGGFANVEEIFDLNHYFSKPAAAKIDKLSYDLEFKTPNGVKLVKQVEILIEEYQQKAKLIFPIKGNFIVGGGHDFNEPHSSEWSQHYAYDIVALGPNFEFAKNNGNANEDFYTWGKEIVAPADGIVIYARNDIPENPQPREIDTKLFMRMPDPMYAVGGNNVVMDHGNGEFSFIAHMQKGSVRVNKGDRVKQGDVIGLLGNTGNSDGPHLHYHFMACETVFRCDGLPSRFENVYDFFTNEKLKADFVKRGLYLQAR